MYQGFIECLGRFCLGWVFSLCESQAKSQGSALFEALQTCVPTQTTGYPGLQQFHPTGCTLRRLPGVEHLHSGASHAQHHKSGSFAPLSHRDSPFSSHGLAGWFFPNKEGWAQYRQRDFFLMGFSCAWDPFATFVSFTDNFLLRSLETPTVTEVQTSTWRCPLCEGCASGG